MSASVMANVATASACKQNKARIIPSLHGIFGFYIPHTFHYVGWRGVMAMMVMVALMAARRKHMKWRQWRRNGGNGAMAA